MTAEIEGVRIEPSHIVRNERGHLLEVARDDDGWVPLSQIYVTATHPSVIKAWYRHRHQTDSLTITSGLARVALYDDRFDSPSKGTVQIIELDETTPRRILVPPMTWHGFMARGTDDALLLHINSTAWDPASPDEEQRDPDDPAMPAVWS